METILRNWHTPPAVTRNLSSRSDRMRMLDGAIAAAAEALTLEELFTDAVAQLTTAIGARDAIMFGFGNDGMPFGIGKCEPVMAKYVQGGYIRDDPHDRVGRRDDALVRRASELFDRAELHRTRAYREFFAPSNTEFTLHCRLTKSGFGEPDAACVLFFRGLGEPDFTRAEAEMISAAVPALHAAARRHIRLQRSESNGQMLETVLETLIGEPVVVFDKYGRPIWESGRAREVVEYSNCVRHPMSESLRAEACKLALMAQRAPTGGSARVSIEFPRMEGESLATAELMVAREARGATYVVARIRQGRADSRKVRALAENFGLTPTENRVLGEIAEGFSNKEIAARRGVSLETARTHVHRVLQKLGVPSRVKAAMLARED